MKRSVVIGAAAMAALFAAGVVAAGQAAPIAGTRTLTVFERGEHVRLIDNPPKVQSPRSPPGFGDALAFNARLTTSGKRTVGHLYGSGAFATNRGQAVITGIYALRGGNLDLLITVKPGYHRAVGAIVGGTGRYAGARGTVTSLALANGDFKDTITILPAG
jgi:hypothetical protein